MLFDSSRLVSMNNPIIPSSSLGYSPPDMTKKHGDYRPLTYSGHKSSCPVSTWISWWDHQFANNLDLVDDYSKSQIATQYLEGTAATWYSSLKEAYHSPPLWQDLKRAIVVMFADDHPVVPSHVPTADHVLRGTVNNAFMNNATHGDSSISTGLFNPGHMRYPSNESDHDTLNVADYTSRFFKTNVDPLPEEALLQRYISGLRPELQREMSAKCPRSVSEAVIFATNAENGKKWPGNSSVFGETRPSERRSSSSNHQTGADLFTPVPRSLPVTAPYFTPGSFASTAAAKTPVGPAAAQKYGVTYAENLHKLTTEERERLRRLGGCFRCRQLGHQKDQCPLLEMGNNVVPPPGINIGVQAQDDPSLNNIPKLTTEERDRLRKFGGCYRCRRLGHQKEDCPMNQTHPSMAHDLDMLSTSSASDTDDTTDTVNFVEDIANVVLKEA